MEYRIKKIQSSMECIKELNGMKVLIFIDYHGRHRIDGPINVDDYDKYYEWLRAEAYRFGITTCDNLEDFKKIFISDPGMFVPTLTEEDFEDVEIVVLKDIVNYNKIYDKYFEKYNEI